MSTRHRSNQHQTQVTAIAMQSDSLAWFWFVTLAAVSAGVFYFFGYYWANLGRVLTGG